jgi:hypothetical protein
MIFRFGARGTKANWKWMGGHGAALYAELIARGVPNELLFAAASAHFDAYWALDKDGEGLNPAPHFQEIGQRD